MRLNPEEFDRRSGELFASSYLTSVGIIQSVALGILSLRFFEAELSLFLVLQLIGSFLAVILIAHEYSWWILLVRRIPGLPDTVVPYFLGAVEFWAMYVVPDVPEEAHRGLWSLALGALGAVGVFSLWHNRSYCTDEIFAECMWLKPLAIRNLNRGIGIIAAGTILLFWMWLYQTRLAEYWKVLVFIELYALQVALLAVSGRFMGAVGNEFKRLRAQQ